MDTPDDLLRIRFAQEADTARLGDPRSAVRVAFARGEASQSASPLAGSWACDDGCAFCCHLRVHVTPGEASLLADAAVARPALRAKLRENAAKAHGLDARAHRLARIRCAFLDAEDRCTCYDVRPIRCRAHVSLSRARCEAAYRGERPGTAADPWLTRLADALHAGLGDGPQVELHAAVLAAIDAGAARLTDASFRRDPD